MPGSRQKVLYSLGLGGFGSWERSQIDEHWVEEYLPLLSSGASVAKSNAGLRLGLERQPSGLEGQGGLPSGLQAQRPVSAGQASVGASPSPPVPWELVGGINQTPPPRPAATEPSGCNIPTPLKGAVAASKLCLSQKPCGGAEGKTPTSKGNMENAKTLFLALPPRF